MASHWPCVTDNSGITTYGLTALGREISTPPTLQPEYGNFTFLLMCWWSGVVMEISLEIDVNGVHMFQRYSCPHCYRSTSRPGAVQVRML